MFGANVVKIVSTIWTLETKKDTPTSTNPVVKITFFGSHDLKIDISSKISKLNFVRTLLTEYMRKENQVTKTRHQYNNMYLPFFGDSSH